MPFFNHLLSAADVEGHASVAVQAEFLVVVDLGFRGGVDGEVGLEVGQFLSRGLDEHVEHEMGLPCHFHDETDGHAGILVGAAEGIHHIKVLAAELLLGEVFHLCPNFFAHRVVVVFVAFGGPPNGVLRLGVHHDVFVLGRATGVDARHHVNCVEFGQNAFVVTRQGGVHLVLEELFVARVIVNFLCAGDAVFGQRGFDFFDVFCHDLFLINVDCLFV